MGELSEVIGQIILATLCGVAFGVVGSVAGFIAFAVMAMKDALR